jgi:hypothetical protein
VIDILRFKATQASRLGIPGQAPYGTQDGQIDRLETLETDIYVLYTKMKFKSILERNVT